MVKKSVTKARGKLARQYGVEARKVPKELASKIAGAGKVAKKQHRELVKAQAEEERRQRRRRAGIKNESSDSAEAAEAEPASLRAQVAQHKKDLASLEKKDPEFYEFLSKEGGDLLGFGEDGDLSSSDDGSDDDDDASDGAGDGGDTDSEEEEGDSSKKAAKQKKTKKSKSDGKDDDEDTTKGVLTAARWKKWVAKLEGADAGSLRQRSALRPVLRAFRSACRVAGGGDDKDDGEGTDAVEITSGPIFHKVLHYCLLNVPKLFDTLAGYKHGEAFAKAKRTVPDRQKPHAAPHYKRVAAMAKSFLRSMYQFLTTSSTVDPAMQEFVARHVGADLLPYLSELPLLQKRFLKALVEVWVGEGRDMSTRVQAFLTLHRMAVCFGSHFREMAIKATYMSFVRNAKFYNLKKQSLVTFWCNGVVEMLGIDFSDSYQYAFVYIRQLAIHLRNVLLAKNKEAHANVYNWQYLNSLSLWTQALVTHAESSDMAALVYPLSQVIIGTARLAQGARYFPLRLHAARMLNDLADATGLYIPLAPLLIDIFQAKELRQKPIETKEKPIALEVALKAPAALVRSRDYQQKVLRQAVTELTRHFASVAHSIAFPELSLPALTHLRKVRANNEIKTPQVTKELGQLLDKIKKNADWVLQHRAGADFSPADYEQCVSYLSQNDKGVSPLAQYAKHRLDEDEKRRKQAREKYDFEEEKKKEQQANSDSSDSDDEDEDEDSSSDDRAAKAPKAKKRKAQESSDDSESSSGSSAPPAKKANSKAKKSKKKSNSKLNELLDSNPDEDMVIPMDDGLWGSDSDDSSSD